MTSKYRIASSVTNIIFCSPLSILATEVEVIPSRCANPAWVNPIACLAFLSSRLFMLYMKYNSSGAHVKDH